MKIANFFKLSNVNTKKIATYVLLFYVVLVTIPFISSRIPILEKITATGDFAIVYRLLNSLLFASYFALIMFVNKIKIHWNYIIFASLLFLFNIIGTLAFSNNITYGDGTNYAGGYFNHDSYYHISYYSVGLITIVKNTSRLLFGLVFGYLLLFVIPESVDKKALIKICYFYVLLSITSCLMSIIFDFFVDKAEFSKLNLRSVFISKNDFGLFLIVGILSSYFLILSKIKNYRLIYCFIPAMIFFAILCGCKTASLIAIAFGFYFLFELFKKTTNKKTIYRILVITSSVLAIIFFIFVFLVAFPTNEYFAHIKENINDYLYYNVQYTVLTRFEIWALSIKDTNFFKVLIGQSWSYGQQHLISSSSFYIGTGFNSYHNSFVMIFAFSGIFGLIFYLMLLIKNIKNRFSIFSKDSLRILIFVMVAMILFSFIEDNLIFISGSGFSLFFSLLLSPLLDKHFFAPYDSQIMEINI